LFYELDDRTSLPRWVARTTGVPRAGTLKIYRVTSSRSARRITAVGKSAIP